MKFFSKEVPPRKKPEAEEEYGIQPEEPIFRPRPEALDVRSLVEKAKEGDAIGMVPELDEYFDGWLHYAQDRNLFSGTGEMQALAQARREAIKLAGEKKYDELQAKLEELSGPLAENVEKAAEENLQRIQQHREATPKEHKEHLAEAVHEVEGIRPHAGPSPEILHGREAEREARAQKFAEKYHLTAEREALLIAEENYADAIRHRNESFFKLKSRDDAATKGQREILESAIQKWRDALTKAGEEAAKNGEKQDALSARFIGARDAMMRMEQVRQRAVAEGLDNRSKTTIGRFDAWANKLNATALGGAAAAAKGFGKVSEAVGGVLVGRFIDKEEDAEKYQRASRIVGSAAIMTAIFAPFGAATAGAAGMAFVWRAARGLGGWSLGSAAGAGAGKLYDLKHGTEAERLRTHEVSQQDLLDALKTGRIEVLDQKEAKQLYKEGSATQFKKSEREHAESKMRAEVAASALVAGASAYGLSHFPPVHEALTNHPLPSAHPETHAPGAEHHGAIHHGPLHHPEARHAPEVLARAAHIESVSVHGNVNDADKLFGRFLDNVKQQFPEPKDAPPALRTLLEQYHHVDGMHQEDVLTRFLHLQNGGSVVVHPGDTLSYENGKVIFQGNELIDEHGNVLDLREAGHVHIEHPQPQPEGHAPAAPQEAARAASPRIVPHTPAPPAPSEAHVEHPAPRIVQPQPHAPAAPAPAPAPVIEAAPASPEAQAVGPRIVPHGEAAPPTPTPSAHAHVMHVEHIQPAAPAPEAPQHAAPAPAPAPAPMETSGPHIVTHGGVIAPEVPPAHVPVPSNDNLPPPVHEAIPTRPLVPENGTIPVHVPPAETHAVPSAEAVPGIIHNSFGVDVDPGTTHIYQLYQPGAENPNVLVAYGGSLDDRLHAVQQYLARPENADKVVFVTGTQPDPTTHNLMTNPWKFDAATKQVNPGFVFTDENGLVPPPPGPNDLQKIVQ